MISKTFNTTNTTETLPKIFCFINSVDSFGYFPVALAEDGTGLAGHASSNLDWAKHDIGFHSHWKHENYQKHYPQGYELVWLEEDDMESPGIVKALENNKALAELQKQKP